MLAKNELEVSLREALPDWWEDLGSIFLIKIEDSFCTERVFLWIFWVWGGDQGCDETSSAGSYDQIKVVRQSYDPGSIFVNVLDSRPCQQPAHSRSLSVPKEKLRNL
jgi:hypothetical protein